MKKISIIIFLICFSLKINSAELKVNYGAYVDSYLATDNDYQSKPWDNSSNNQFSRQYSFANLYKNEFNINIAQISATFDFTSKARGKITLQKGTLADAGFSGNLIQEAFAGFQLIDGLWLDAGYFLTHIGGESYLPKDNWLSTHSMVTYFEPFFHSGIKLSYIKEKYTLALHILNGNNMFNDNNDNKSLGTFLSYNFLDNLSASYAGIYGNEEPGSPNYAKIHMLHNICLNYKPLDKFETKAQLDFATKAKSKIDGTELKDGSFLGFSIQVRYTFLDNLKATARFANFDDSDNIYGTGIDGIDLTLGIEYKPSNNGYIRLEGNILNLSEGINKIGYKFIDADKKATNSRNSIMLNCGIYLD